MSSLKDKTVTMAHGAGGRQTSELIDQIFAAHFANPDLTADDAEYCLWQITSSTTPAPPAALTV